jgi:hypothetical protein
MVDAAVMTCTTQFTWSLYFSTNTAHVALFYGCFVVADHVAMLPTLPLSLNVYSFGYIRSRVGPELCTVEIYITLRTTSNFQN